LFCSTRSQEYSSITAESPRELEAAGADCKEIRIILLRREHTKYIVFPTEFGIGGTFVSTSHIPLFLS
jgi:hypothetical protein